MFACILVSSLLHRGCKLHRTLVTDIELAARVLLSTWGLLVSVQVKVVAQVGAGPVVAQLYER